jgi:hypothetical protein
MPIRIKFTDEELEWLQHFLEDYDSLTDEEVKWQKKLRRKLNKAWNYHFANMPKKVFLDAYREGIDTKLFKDLYNKLSQRGE